tara:strand:+ start:16 stop:1185 length:1170 start_codon:yes stop_codon:yes gene_type:complete
MLDKLSKFIYFFDVGDLRFFYLIAKKNFKNLAFLTLLVSTLVYTISLNLEKRYKSEATIVISPDENKIVDIEEVYSINTNRQSRVNNRIAILKSDEVLEFIVDDEKKQLEFERLYSNIETSFLRRILRKSKQVDKDYIKKILRENFTVSNIPRSDVLQLTFISKDPKISQLALKSIINSYQRYEVDSKIQITTYANEKITSRLKELVTQIDDAEKKLSNYKRENNLVDTGNVKELKIKEIESISKRIIDAKKDDVVFIDTNSDAIHVFGEVSSPGVYYPDLDYSLTELISTSGLNQLTANSKKVYVIRENFNKFLSVDVFQLDIENPINLIVGRKFILHPKDIVFIPPAPIVKWNRAISLLLPQTDLFNSYNPIIQDGVKGGANANISE